MPIATGLEREEIEAELQVSPLCRRFISYHDALFVGERNEILLGLIRLSVQGKKRFDMDAPVGPFGTKVRAFRLTSSECHLTGEQSGPLNLVA